MRRNAWLIIFVLLPVLPACLPVAAVGVGAGVLMTADRRTAGTILEDAKIEAHIGTDIFAQFKESVHINVTSFNHHVLLTGEAPAEADKTKVEQMASAVPGVKGVSNELVVAAPSSFGTRSNDGFVTSNVKLRFIDNKVFQPDHIKVVTENGSVFLMGLVYRKEAEAATEIARNSKGVQRVVTVFEYLD